MEGDTLDSTSWDVLIAGTGLHESLLALALSRSGKSVLHVDKNNYYGGSSAALTLQDAQEWANKHASTTQSSDFANARLINPSPELAPQLGFSRAYSLALAPQIIYAQSAILASLVSSRVDSQLEFLAVGSCFVFTTSDDDSTGSLLRVPNSREDIFADQSLEPKHKRGLMKFIRFIVDFDDQDELWDQNQTTPFDDFLSANFNLPESVQRPLQALTLSLSTPHDTQTKFALPRIARHLRSIGIFGPGFGSIIPKWGGLAEIAQVGCRACAVGGGVYVLGNGVQSTTPKSDATSVSAPDPRNWQVTLEKGEKVSADWIASSWDNLPSNQSSSLTELKAADNTKPRQVLSHLIAIVSSPLAPLFPQIVEGAPAPAVAIVQFPDSKLFHDSENHDSYPVHIMIHSSDTGECPSGQSILYASVACNAELGYSILDDAVGALIKSVDNESAAQILWKLQYEKLSHDFPGGDSTAQDNSTGPENFVLFPRPSLDLAFTDQVLRDVHAAWQTIVGLDGGDFMTFPPRGAVGQDDEND